MGSAFRSYGSVCFVESQLEDDKKREVGKQEVTAEILTRRWWHRQGQWQCPWRDSLEYYLGEGIARIW